MACAASCPSAAENQHQQYLALLSEQLSSVEASLETLDTRVTQLKAELRSSREETERLCLAKIRCSSSCNDDDNDDDVSGDHPAEQRDTTSTTSPTSIHNNSCAALAVFRQRWSDIHRFMHLRVLMSSSSSCPLSDQDRRQCHRTDSPQPKNLLITTSNKHHHDDASSPQRLSNSNNHHCVSSIGSGDQEADVDFTEFDLDRVVDPFRQQAVSIAAGRVEDVLRGMADFVNWFVTVVVKKFVSWQNAVGAMRQRLDRCHRRFNCHSPRLRQFCRDLRRRRRLAALIHSSSSCSNHHHQQEFLLLGELRRLTDQRVDLNRQRKAFLNDLNMRLARPHQSSNNGKRP